MTVLVVGAIGQELTGAHERARLLACGIGPVEAAIRVTAEIARERPSAVINVGLAGARRGSGIRPLEIVIGSEAVYCDLYPRFAPTHLAPDPGLLAAARLSLPEARVLPIGTSASIGGSNEVEVEAMEGYSVLRVAQLAGVPALELRAISNEVEEPSRSSWHIDDGLIALARATERLLDALR
jgi:nucleoside phosphorylase